MVIFAGCGNAKSKEDTNLSTSNNTTETKDEASGNQIGIKAGDTSIYMDEVRYYAYKTQGTYEVYYLSKDKVLDWNQELSEGVTLQEGVKSEVLDGICKRLALFEKADDYNIFLTQDQKEEVVENVEYYFTNSSEKMINKVNISIERLKEVYEKEMIAGLVEQAMEDKERGSSDAMYLKWKQDNKVITEKAWDDINFDEKIIIE